jgi:hypothetical protein
MAGAAGGRMIYAAIDPVIKAWSDSHALTLFTAFGGQEGRFVYVAGGPQECFQISIEPPERGKVLVNAWSVETIDDAELHDSWLVSAEQLRSALDLAFDKLMGWKARPKGPATWQPHS